MKAAKFLALVSLVVFFAGCMEMEMNYSLSADGSGKQKMVIKLDKEILDAMKELQEISKESGGGGQMKMDGGEALFALFKDNRKKLEEELKKSELTLTAFEKTEKEGAMKLIMEVAFKDWRHAAASELMGGATGGVSIIRNGDGSFRLKMETQQKKDADKGMKPGGFPGMGKGPGDSNPQDMQKAMEAMQKSMAVMGKLMAKMNDFKMNMKFTLPGEIVTAKGGELKGNSVTYTINAQNMMMMQTGGMDPDITFKGSGITLNTEPLPTK